MCVGTSFHYCLELADSIQDNNPEVYMLTLFKKQLLCFVMLHIFVNKSRYKQFF